jgi:hypothetical protein
MTADGYMPRHARTSADGGPGIIADGYGAAYPPGPRPPGRRRRRALIIAACASGALVLVAVIAAVAIGRHGGSQRAMASWCAGQGHAFYHEVGNDNGQLATDAVNQDGPSVEQDAQQQYDDATQAASLPPPLSLALQRAYATAMNTTAQADQALESGDRAVGGGLLRQSAAQWKPLAGQIPCGQ